EVPGAYDEYWERRGRLDVLWTHRLAEFLEKQLPPQCRRGYVIEARCIAQLANSWLMGIYVNPHSLRRAEEKAEADIADGCSRLGLSESVLGSPAQLGRVVFGEWGFEP